MLPPTRFQETAEAQIGALFRAAGLEIIHREIFQLIPRPDDVPRMTHIRLVTKACTIWLYDQDACIDDGERKRVLELEDYAHPDEFMRDLLAAVAELVG